MEDLFSRDVEEVMASLDERIDKLREERDKLTPGWVAAAGNLNPGNPRRSRRRSRGRMRQWLMMSLFRLPRRRHNKLAWNRARRLFRLQRELGWSIADIEDIPFEVWCDRRAMRRGYLYRKLRDFEQQNSLQESTGNGITAIQIAHLTHKKAGSPRYPGSFRPSCLASFQLPLW